jgi:cyclase
MSKGTTLIGSFTMIACFAGLVVLPAVQAQTTAPSKPQQQPARLTVEALRDGVYWVSGGGGANTGFVIGKREVVVIDAKMTEESAKEMLAEINKLTTNPLKYVVLTHSDGDHVNGLSAFPKGLTIVAHVNTRRYMEEAFKDPKMSALVPYLPNETLAGGGPLNIEGVQVNLLYFGPAHTSGDLVVHLPDQKIAFLGDLVFVGRDPLIHRHKDGTSLGLVQTLKKILALDADTFVTGHSAPLTKADIRGVLASIEEKQAKVKALIQQGRSLDEVKKAFGLEDRPGQVTQRRPGLIEIIHQELSEKK